MRRYRRYHFAPAEYEAELTAIVAELSALPTIDASSLGKVLRRYPKDGRCTFSKAEIIGGYRHLAKRNGWTDDGFIEKLRMKPIRTASGVAPVTILTKPYPCPGRCVFCPNDVRMPKSYLAMEPGAQRATQNRFDPYAQTTSRLLAFHLNGHRVDKVEIIILGGTWSFYPDVYQIWFVKRCLDALNDFTPQLERTPSAGEGQHDFLDLEQTIDGRHIDRSYNAVVRGHLETKHAGALLDSGETASWAELEQAQRRNETAACRSVGLVVETRPDQISTDEVVRIRRLGATKVQLGLQSLNDEVLAANQRGHDVAASRRAMALVRAAGFKVHAHWMPNLYRATVASDIADFGQVFGDVDFRPDELKIYPCSLIETAELMRHYEAGQWRPYSADELIEVLAACLPSVPRYCRLTRVIRDIPSHDIVAGNKLSNFRQVAEQSITGSGHVLQDIRSREIRGTKVDPNALQLRETEYETSVGTERFCELVTGDDRIAGFLRLSLPRSPVFLDEIAGSAMIREVHVYGPMVGLGEGAGDKAQHAGLGRRLVEHAAAVAAAAGFGDLAVISAIGTSGYYRALGFSDGPLYLHRTLRSTSATETITAPTDL